MPSYYLTRTKPQLRVIKIFIVTREPREAGNKYGRLCAGQNNTKLITNQF